MRLVKRWLAVERSTSPLIALTILKKLTRSRGQIQILQPSILLMSIHSAIAQDRFWCGDAAFDWKLRRPEQEQEHDHEQETDHSSLP